MAVETTVWLERARAQAIAEFQLAWERAPVAGRTALIAAAERGGVGHRWETGRHACVLALLVAPARKAKEQPKMAAYRIFGCEVTDDFPVTWDASGVTLMELLTSVGVRLPARRAGGRVSALFLKDAR